MLVYKVGRYTFSADLTRYSKEVGKEGNYTLGYCTVEFLPKGNSLYHPEPKIIDPNKPYDIIEFDKKAEINGSLAIQCQPEKYNVSVDEEISWIAISIGAPDGDLDKLIKSVASESGIEVTDTTLAQTRERLLVQYSKPKNSNPETVGALIRNTSAIRADYFYKARVRALADELKTTTRQAEWLAFIGQYSKMVEKEGGWQPEKWDLDEPATLDEIKQLVDIGALEYEEETQSYTNTELAKEALRVNYLLGE